MIHSFLKFLARFVFTKLYKVEVQGIENIPLEGKVILAGNHCSFLDPMVLFHLSPRKFYAVVSKAIYNIRWLTWVFKATSCIPTNGSSQGAIEVLHQDKMVLIFPEGGCSCDGQIHKVRKGTAVLALKTAAPVVPVLLNGTYEVWPARRFLPVAFRPIHVRFGRPIYFEKMDGEIIPDEALDSCIMRVVREIKNMC